MHLKSGNCVFRLKKNGKKPKCNPGKKFSTDSSPQTRHAFIAMIFITSGKDVCYHLMMCIFCLLKIVNLKTVSCKTANGILLKNVIYLRYTPQERKCWRRKLRRTAKPCFKIIIFFLEKANIIHTKNVGFCSRMV